MDRSLREQHALTTPGLPTPDFVIADTHFGHANILKYEPSRRQWGSGSVQDVAAMDEYLVRAWNARVRHHHTVLHVGDFVFGPREYRQGVRRQLNGRIVLVRGNHDRSVNWLGVTCDVVVRRWEMNVEGVGLVIARHNPADFTADEISRAAVLLHGHRHTRPLDADTFLQGLAAKARCASVELLPFGAPIEFGHLIRSSTGETT